MLRSRPLFLHFSALLPQSCLHAAINHVPAILMMPCTPQVVLQDRLLHLQKLHSSDLPITQLPLPLLVAAHRPQPPTLLLPTLLLPTLLLTTQLLPTPQPPTPQPLLPTPLLPTPLLPTLLVIKLPAVLPLPLQWWVMLVKLQPHQIKQQ